LDLKALESVQGRTGRTKGGARPLPRSRLKVATTTEPLLLDQFPRLIVARN
jgi:hypothetical protein